MKYLLAALECTDDVMGGHVISTYALEEIYAKGFGPEQQDEGN